MTCNILSKCILLLTVQEFQYTTSVLTTFAFFVNKGMFYTALISSHMYQGWKAPLSFGNHLDPDLKILNKFLPRRWNWRQLNEFVFVFANSRSCQRILNKYSWSVRCLTSNEPLDSVADPDQKLDPGILTEFYHSGIGSKFRRILPHQRPWRRPARSFVLVLLNNRLLDVPESFLRNGKRYFQKVYSDTK